MLVVLLAITLFVFFVVDILRHFFMKETASWMQFILFFCRQVYFILQHFFHISYKQIYDAALMLSIMCLTFCKNINHNLEMLSMQIVYLQTKIRC